MAKGDNEKPIVGPHSARHAARNPVPSSLDEWLGSEGEIDLDGSEGSDPILARLQRDTHNYPALEGLANLIDSTRAAEQIIAIAIARASHRYPNLAGEQDGALAGLVGAELAVMQQEQIERASRKVPRILG